MKIRAWRLALGGRKPIPGVDLHHTNSLAKNWPSAYSSLLLFKLFLKMNKYVYTYAYDIDMSCRKKSKKNEGDENPSLALGAWQAKTSLRM